MGADERDPFGALVRQRCAERMRIGFALLTLFTTVSGVAEWLTFPARRTSIVALYAGLVLMIAGSVALVRRRRDWSVGVLVACVNLVAVAATVYHAAHAASAEWCLLILTALLTTSTLIFPWGGPAQAIACTGAVLTYPLVLAADPQSALPALTALTYLASVVGMCVFGAALIQGHLRSDFLLTAAVRASETRLRAYFEQALIGVALSSPEGNWLEVNDAFCRLVGYTRDELRGMSWADVLHPDDLAPAPPGPRPRGRSVGADAYSVERRLRRKDGHVVRAVITGRWLRSGDGEPEQLVEMVREWSWSRG